MESLKGKVVIVTGSSKGIGAATAVEFAKYGAKVSITGRDEAGLADTKSECIKAGLPEENIAVIIADVGKEEDIKKIVDKTVEKFGVIDSLINNAGMPYAATLGDTDMDKYDEVFNVNVRGLFYISKLCLPYLKKSKGSIVNVSSFFAFCPLAAISLSYGMTKAAVDSFTKGCAIDLGRYGIRVNSVNPGCIETDIYRKAGFKEFNEFYKYAATTVPLGRTGRAEEIAKLITYLASDGASYVTGDCVRVDGGATTIMAMSQLTLNGIQEKIDKENQEAASEQIN